MTLGFPKINRNEKSVPPFSACSAFRVPLFSVYYSVQQRYSVNVIKRRRNKADIGQEGKRRVEDGTGDGKKRRRRIYKKRLTN